ncbi:MAG: sulfatase-like hydrolase/transferase [Armatimonadota bacterium]|jgi:arylsulfatase A-like enzyme
MRRPNLLFIYTDEQAAKTMSAYGNSLIETPSLDRLAGDSLVFENAYVTQPVCTPSRSSLLTGLYPHSNGCTANNIPLPRDVQCLPELSDFSEYRTAHMGKWHLGDEIFAQHGFDEWVSIEDGYRTYYNPWRDKDQHCDYWHWLVDEQGVEPPESEDGFNAFSRGQAARLPEKHSKPAFLAERATQFLNEVGEQPFMLFVNFLEPHMPFFGPRDDQYDPDDVPLPDNFDAVPGPDAPLKLRLLYEHYRHAGASGLPLQTEDDWKRLIANYWGLCSLVDTYVGRILDALERSGHADDTIVVFTSDHGDMMGSHQLVAKTVMYEESVRVPMLLRVPWMPQATGRVERPVSQIDVVPTLLDLLGNPVPSHLQGRSWRPEMHDPGSFAEHDVFIEWNGSNNGMMSNDSRDLPDHIDRITSYQEAWRAFTARVRTIITPTGWKFNCSPLGEHELYNLHQDPGETENLIDDPAVTELVADLYERLLAWQQETEDDAHLGSDPRRRRPRTGG